MKHVKKDLTSVVSKVFSTVSVTFWALEVNAIGYHLKILIWVRLYEEN